MKRYYVYILASDRNGTLYIGVTSNLSERIKAHEEHVVKGFSDIYDVTMLVYVEACETARQMVEREKQLKKWKRIWKLRLIEEMNPDWEDLSEKENFQLE